MSKACMDIIILGSKRWCQKYILALLSDLPKFSKCWTQHKTIKTGGSASHPNEKPTSYPCSPYPRLHLGTWVPTYPTFHGNTINFWEEGDNWKGILPWILSLPWHSMYIIHEKFSNNVYLFLLLFNTFSNYLRAYDIPASVNMITLLEKSLVLDIFGYACRYQSARARYHLSYIAYALVLGIRYPKLHVEI